MNIYQKVVLYFYLIFIVNPPTLMKSLLLFLSAVLLATSTVIPRVEPIVTHVPKTYKVSLDDPPEVRWKQIMEDFKVPLAKFM
jgi:hypothetical protein